MSSVQIKIAIVDGDFKKDDAFRGIGAHNSSLLEAFDQFKKPEIEICNINSDDDYSKYNIVHFTSFRPFNLSLPFKKPKNTKFILTIHDLIPLIFPEHYPPGFKGKVKFLINKFLIKMNIDRIITISETSKKDICRFLKVKPEIVDVIYIAPKRKVRKLNKGKWVSEIKKRFNLPDKFILFNHGLNFNKNLKTLIEASSEISFPLVAVDEDTKKINSLDLNHPELNHLKGVDFSKVIRPGYVSDNDLNKLYNLAAVCVQPSLYEGFGMPPIEAMMVGCPVICSRTQALVEVCDKGCLYFDPNSTSDLVKCLKEVINNNYMRKKYISEGFVQSKKYTWYKTAKETLDVYMKV